MWRKALLFQKLGGRRLPPNLPAWAVPLLTRCRSFRSPSTETRRRYPSRCAMWHATWQCQTPKTGERRIYPGLGFCLRVEWSSAFSALGFSAQLWGRRGSSAFGLCWRNSSVQWSKVFIRNRIAGICFYPDEVSAFEGKDTVHTNWLHLPGWLNIIPPNCIVFPFLVNIILRMACFVHSFLGIEVKNRRKVPLTRH